MNCGADVTLINCTISNNVAGQSGGGILNDDAGSLTVSNTVLWDNYDGAGSGEQSQILNNQGLLIVNYNCVQGWTGTLGGTGNIGDDPHFLDPDGLDDNAHTSDDNDYRLSSGSPCTDAADNTAVPEGIETDLDGNPRFVDDPNTDDTGFGDPPIVDMGAYEFRDPCADDDGDGRVTICHIPPGNPDNAHTITVSVNALPAHLAHGDYCGPCEGGLSAALEAGGMLGAQDEINTRESVAPVLRERGP